jgi:hypothetical protein
MTKYIDKEGKYGNQKSKEKIPSPFFVKVLMIIYFKRASVTTSALMVLRS